MRIDDNGVYISITEGKDRFVPWSVYKKVEEGVKNLRTNPGQFPKPLKWLIKRIVKDIDPQVHAEISLQGILQTVKELGEKIEWGVA